MYVSVDNERLTDAEEMLMNVEFVRRPVMQYRDLEFQYESEGDELGTEFARQQSEGKQYRKKRSSKPRRRRVPKNSHPGYGIAGRRNRRWTW